LENARARTSIAPSIPPSVRVDLRLITGLIPISPRDPRRFQILQRSRRRLSTPLGRPQCQKRGRSGNLSSYFARHDHSRADHVLLCSEPPRSLISMRACSNPSRRDSLPHHLLPRRIPFHVFTSHHHLLDHIHPILLPDNTATLPTAHRGLTGKRRAPGPRRDTVGHLMNGP
jgi:hypothetical protein